MATAQPVLFRDTSDLNIDPATRIISLSDIHGDMDALIIALRDCARVIRPHSGIPNPGDNSRDPELDRLLNLDLTDIANMHEFDDKCDLGFDWIGDTTHVVLIGDTIDPIRKSAYGVLQTATTMLPNKRNVNDVYPQAEIKILKFLNKLDELAEIQRGRVIKLIGNHEITNFSPGHAYGDLYTHDGFEKIPFLDRGVIQTLPRNQYFNLNNPGFRLFMERGSGVFLRINNIIFVHGQIYNMNKKDFTYKYCSDFNSWINNNAVLSGSDPIFNKFVNSNHSPQLWDREYGDDNKIHTRLRYQQTSATFCDGVKTDINTFLSDHPQKHMFVLDNIRVVIGHCLQSYSSWYNEINRTFTTKIVNGNVVELIGPAETFNINQAQLDNNNLFGISMECPEATEPHHKIFRVDVGTSRGFDQNSMYPLVNNHTEMKRYFLSRVPQVLQFQADDVRIIRSTLKNARIHQVRHDFENIVNSKITSDKLPQDMSIANMTYGGYKEKYLKYKSKYLELKKKIVN